jgi:hypothetical protein
MRETWIEKARCWDLTLACGSLSLVMLLLTSVLHIQHRKPEAARASVAISFAEFAQIKKPDSVSRPGR